jgi:hypothetical protein
MDYGAEGNGSTDDTVAFQNCASDAEAFGGSVAFVMPPGVYILSQQIVIELTGVGQKLVLRGAGSQATILIWTAAASTRGFLVQYPYSAQYSTPSSTTIGAKGISFLSRAPNVGTGLTLQGTGSPITMGISQNWLFDDLQFPLEGTTNNGWQIGMSTTMANGIIFSKCIFWGSAAPVSGTKGIYLGAPSGSSSNDVVIFDHCNFTTHEHSVEFDGAGVVGFQTVLIEASTMLASKSCIYAMNAGTTDGGSEDWIIRDTYLICQGSTGAQTIALNNIARVWIHDCFFDYSSGLSEHLYATGCQELKIHDNMFRGGNAGETGLYLSGTSSASVHHNEFAALSYDFNLTGSSNVRVLDNQYLDGSNNYRACTGVDGGTNNQIGNQYANVSVVNMAGGQAYETFSIDITQAGRITQPQCIGAQCTSPANSKLIVGYNYDDSNATSVQVSVFNPSGTTPSGDHRLGVMVGAGVP